MRSEVCRAFVAIGVVVGLVGGCSAKPESAVGPGGPPPWVHTIGSKGQVSRGWSVSRVVDGDTVDVVRNGRELRVRLIGIDSPETVHPLAPVECFGPESMAFAEHELFGEPVLLEFDHAQGRRDYYDRTLAYVWVARPGRPLLFNLAAVRQGFAAEYTYGSPYAWQPELERAERVAIIENRGLWGACR